MSCCNICVDIIIPLICALISGGLTVLGVVLTIRHENKKIKETFKLSKKPILYRIDPNQNYDYQNAENYQFNYISKKSTQKIYGILKNTDNALLFLKYISINDKKLFPDFGKVVDKNVIFNISIYIEETITEDTIINLCVSDVLDNEYYYSLDIDLSDKNEYIMITNVKEIQ